MHAIVEARWFSTCTQPVRANAHKFAPPSLTMIINGKLFDAVSPTTTRDSLSTGRKINEKRKNTIKTKEARSVNRMHQIPIQIKDRDEDEKESK